ncbi:MAG: hypothetical protein LUE27_06525 [Clostridia bacterium]|nr:hypothetical protein [Clostridia bacterium]
MFIEDAIKEATKSFMKNPFWRKLYNEAPSDVCRRYMELTFCHSLNIGDYSFYPDMEKVEDRMDIKDWEYAGKYFGNNMYRAYCNKRIEALKAKA